jgi:hypothetical protein
MHTPARAHTHMHARTHTRARAHTHTRCAALAALGYTLGEALRMSKVCVYWGLGFGF